MRSAQALPIYTVPLAQLQAMVDPKFPRSVPVQGMFNLTVQTPHLRLLPEVNRLGAAMALELGGGVWLSRKAEVPLFALEQAGGQ